MASTSTGSTSRPDYIMAALGILGGAVLGCLAFHFAVMAGFYAMVAPGALIGLGCGAQSKAISTALGIAAAISGLALGLLLEWHYFPFLKDDSLGYFLANLRDLKTGTWVMILAGSGLAFFFGRGR